MRSIVVSTRFQLSPLNCPACRNLQLEKNKRKSRPACRKVFVMQAEFRPRYSSQSSAVTRWSASQILADIFANVIYAYGAARSSNL